ncbi:MAG: hypothetical protein ACQES2_05780 [Pseudomonadota bacterium]
MKYFVLPVFALLTGCSSMDTAEKPANYPEEFAEFLIEDAICDSQCRNARKHEYKAYQLEEKARHEDLSANPNYADFLRLEAEGERKEAEKYQ